MLVGMTVVFSFLCLLVVAIIGMSRLALAIGPPPEGPEEEPREVSPSESDIVAAIASALHMYRKGIQ